MADVIGVLFEMVWRSYGANGAVWQKSTAMELSGATVRTVVIVAPRTSQIRPSG